MPIIFSVLSSQFSVLSLGELFLANYIKYIQAKDRCVGMMHILCAHFRHDGLFAFKWNFSECSFLAWGAFRKIPNADFFIRKRLEKFRGQAFFLGSIRNNSARKLCLVPSEKFCSKCELSLSCLISRCLHSKLG